MKKTMLVLALLAGGTRFLCAATPNEELIAATAKGDPARAEQALDAGAKANARDGGLRENETALMKAAASGNRRLVEQLIVRGARVNEQAFDTTALIEAVKKKDREMVFLLLAKGADVDLTGNADFEALHRRPTTALGVAVENNDREIVRLLMERSPSADVSSYLYRHDRDWLRSLVDAWPRMKKDAALGEAVTGKDIEMVRWLLEKGADANAANRDGRTPLFDAVAAGSVESAQLLLTHGANVNKCCWRGNGTTGVENVTPLMEAAGNGDPALVRLLLAAGADAAAVATFHPLPQFAPTQAVPMNFAAQSRNAEVVSLLRKAGAPEYAPNASLPELDWCLERGYVQGIYRRKDPVTKGTVVEFLITYRDADNDPPKRGCPLLHVTKGGDEITGSPFLMEQADAYNGDDRTYDKGMRYRYTVTLPTGRYYYRFEARDYRDGEASGTPTKELPMPGMEQ